ncbi:ATP-binding protein [Streptomyces tirandamycinicus]|uniref:AlbA family DNA-binding domain-containing protein n=1 Tax=Streptomyces tirandamycinicus TaxID=2174846 RepID=UPI003449D800
MTPDELHVLLRRAEGECHDYKTKLHDTSTPKGKADLVKDVISMANTPREEDAHIVFGVKDQGNGQFDLLGVGSVPDDAGWQQLLASAVEPTPRFSLEPIQLGGTLYAVLTIPPDRRGPFHVRPEWRNKLNEHLGPATLVHGVTYYRSGSSNAVATGDTLRWIVQWMNGGSPESLRGGDALLEDAWERFLERVQRFSDARRFVLVAPRIEASGLAMLRGLAAPPWSAVLDLDPLSEQGGLMGELEKDMSLVRSLYRVLPSDETMALGGRNASQWIFAKGLATGSEPPTPLTFRKWSAQYGRDLSRHLAQLAASLHPAPVTCLILGYDTSEIQILHSLLSDLAGSSGEALDVVIATDEASAYEQVAGPFEADVIPISLQQLCAGLARLEPETSTSDGAQRTLPSVSGAPVALDAADAPWIEEELEVLYLDPPSEESDNDRRGFLQGSEISWYALSRRADVDRSKTASLHAKVARELDRGGRPVRVNLYHTSGAGGTTVARRVLWDLHHLYPCVVLLGNPSAQHAGNKWAEDNAERIMRLGHVTQRRVLVLAESSRVPERLLSDLYDSLQNRQASAVVLQVLRRAASVIDDQRVVQLPSFLLDQEADRFLEEYTQARPDRSLELGGVRRSANQRERVPFHFGLAAYGRDFLGLDRYVMTRLDGLESAHRELLQHIALAHHYGQKGMPAQLFAEMLQVPATRPVSLASLLPDQVLDLLVQEEPGVWRMAHALFAEEVLSHLLGAGLQTKSNWKAGLADAAISFARLCHGGAGVVGDTELDLIERIFIYRDSRELMGTEQAASKSFSQLIEDISLPNSAVRLLEQLTLLFPSESHLHAHLARYQAVRMHDLARAKSSIDRALELSNSDSVVYHMKGMIHRQEVYDLMSQKSALSSVVRSAEIASEAFSTSRELRRDNEHGYISEVQMLLRLAEYARQQVDGNNRPAFTYTGEHLVDSALERSEDLLAQVAQLRTVEQPSKFAVRCRAQLDELYGNHEEAVQRYRSLLGRADVDSPSVRRSLVWVYLKKAAGQWHGLKPKDMRTIETLLRENLREQAGDDRTMRLWIRAARHVPNPPSVDELIGQFSTWHLDNPSLESSYYLYVLHVLKYFESSSPVARGEAERYMEECRRRAQYRTDRTRSFEWLGSGVGISGLVHQSRLGEWDSTRDFFKHAALLSRVEGRVGQYVGPTKGWIDVNGLPVFYVPGRPGHQRHSAHHRVTCVVGFSYEGLRAWEVRDV